MQTSQLDQSVIALIPAAGNGSRMGASFSKLLLPIAGEPIIVRTLRAIGTCTRISQVILLVPAEEESAFRSVINPALLQSLPFTVQFVHGGATRQDSVRCGLEYLEHQLKLDPSALVMVHDGARCFATQALFERAVDAAAERGAVTAAQSLVDSIKQVDAHGQVVRSLNRQGVWAIQTPQVFRMELLQAAHRAAEPGALDDASLVEALHPVWVVEGERANVKITTPEDYELAVRDS